MPLSALVLFRDSPQRRRALLAPPGSAERYCLFGLDQLAERGLLVRHNLERLARPAWARAAAALANGLVEAAGGYGGDFASVLACRRQAEAADVVLSTVDTEGLPLVLAARAGLVATPIVYCAIGLPERLARLRGERVRRAYRTALRRVRTVVAYSEREADELRAWLGGGAPRVEFVRFGVDTSFFAPSPERSPDADVVAVGADPHRDFALLLRLAASRPARTFRIVTTALEARRLQPRSGNVLVETDLPFAEARDRLAGARVVALPVRENSYSGATTVLLQAMAMAKPVVVSRTEAIARGYELVDGDNCRLVAPGDERAFGAALDELLADERAAARLGACARETAERCFRWERYVDAMHGLLAGAAGGHR